MSYQREILLKILLNRVEAYFLLIASISRMMGKQLAESLLYPSLKKILNFVKRGHGRKIFCQSRVDVADDSAHIGN